MRENGRNILAIVLIITILYSFALTIWTFNELNKISVVETTTGKVSFARVEFCVNTPPRINDSGCPRNVFQNQTYICKINASDPDFGIIDVYIDPTQLQVNRTFGDNTTKHSTDLPFNISPEGNINWTPTNDYVGWYLLGFTTDDGSGCANSRSSTSFELNVTNINDAPYLINNISDISFYQGETIFAFFLNDYFRDPDLDPLVYFASGNTDISILITGSSQVVLSAANCGMSELVIFTASDPYGAMAESNPVTISCINKTEPQKKNEGGGGGSGGGGGGTVQLCEKPEFECFEYHRCNITNQKIERCVDKHGCEKDKFLTLPCTYEPRKFCNESWDCSNWTACLPNGTQTRTCNDLSFCETNYSKPTENRSCTYIGTCNDNIMNCHDGSCEEGIDCDGPCSACKSIQVPYPIKQQQGVGIYIVTGIILLILTAIITYHYFRKEINSAFAKLSWYLTKKKRKQILLSKEDQKKLLLELTSLDAKLAKASKKEELFELINKHTDLLKYYLSKVLDYTGNEMDEAVLKSQIEKKKSKIIPILRSIFISMFLDSQKVSRNENLIAGYKLRLMIEELRNIVLQTSAVEPGEYSRDVQEIKPEEKDNLVNRTIIRLINAYIALQFVEIDVAKKKYLEIISEYEKMTEVEEEMLFEDVKRLFHNINYENSWAWRVRKN
jgi:hypothetical protein